MSWFLLQCSLWRSTDPCGQISFATFRLFVCTTSFYRSFSVIFTPFFLTSLMLDNYRYQTRERNITKPFIKKHLTIQLPKLQIDVLKLNATFGHCKKFRLLLRNGVLHSGRKPCLMRNKFWAKTKNSTHLSKRLMAAELLKTMVFEIWRFFQNVLDASRERISIHGIELVLPACSSFLSTHYDDVIMDWIASQITSLPVVCSIVYSGVNQRKHQSSASLAFVREIHRGPVNFPHKWPVTRKMFPYDDVIM